MDYMELCIYILHPIVTRYIIPNLNKSHFFPHNKTLEIIEFIGRVQQYQQMRYLDSSPFHTAEPDYGIASLPASRLCQLIKSVVALKAIFTPRLGGPLIPRGKRN